MGGGNARANWMKSLNRGLSPRGRGKPESAADARIIMRSIPAWAGETVRRPGQASFPRVYPRVGGGNGEPPEISHPIGGLSPRGRGKRIVTSASRLRSGSIPAWAGETGVVVVHWCPPAVYPRVGGGNLPELPVPGDQRGLSPRGRGKRSDNRPTRDTQGSIPAWAGETGPGRPACCGFGVYPRVGGGNGRRRQPGPTPGGLSPRGRGKPGEPTPEVYERRSIPAWAGETPSPDPPGRRPGVYPRVGGGNPGPLADGHAAQGLSPRGRGKRWSW